MILFSPNLYSIRHLRRCRPKGYMSPKIQNWDINWIGHGCANHATEGKCFCPPSTAVTQRSLPTCSGANYVLHPCSLIACMCTPSAVCATVSASLCSEHVILTSGRVVGEVTSPNRDTMCHFCAPVGKAICFRLHLYRIKHTVPIKKLLFLRFTSWKCLVWSKTIHDHQWGSSIEVHI